MKVMNFFMFGLIAVLYAPCVWAQVAPSVTGKYSDAEIDRLIHAYAVAVSKETPPSQTLRQKLEKDFPGAWDVEWERAENVYEAEFEIGHTDYRACYDREGNLLMYYYEVTEAKLPSVVRDAAKRYYPKYRFDEIKKVHKGTAVFYKIEMERRDVEVKMVIKSDGSFVENWID
ncbi:MAG: hypothetical protein LBF89_12500 [Bacteroidales bacterium]|nr:hypothetical protein [Bacteroidales bacterium]